MNKHDDVKWERLNGSMGANGWGGVTRLRIDGGWLYRTVVDDDCGGSSCAMVFVPISGQEIASKKRKGE